MIENGWKAKMKGKTEWLKTNENRKWKGKLSDWKLMDNEKKKKIRMTENDWKGTKRKGKTERPKKNENRRKLKGKKKYG